MVGPHWRRHGSSHRQVGPHTEMRYPSIRIQRPVCTYSPLTCIAGYWIPWIQQYCDTTVCAYSLKGGIRPCIHGYRCIHAPPGRGQWCEPGKGRTRERGPARRLCRLLLPVRAKGGRGAEAHPPARQIEENRAPLVQDGQRDEDGPARSRKGPRACRVLGMW